MCMYSGQYDIIYLPFSLILLSFSSPIAFHTSFQNKCISTHVLNFFCFMMFAAISAVAWCVWLSLDRCNLFIAWCCYFQFFSLSLFLWSIYVNDVCVCVRACVHACMRVCDVCVCMLVRACICVCTCVDTVLLFFIGGFDKAKASLHSLSCLVWCHRYKYFVTLVSVSVSSVITKSDETPISPSWRPRCCACGEGTGLRIKRLLVQTLVWAED